MRNGKLFNVIIPTRERADTLIHTLRTVVSQDYENLNIIVSDNYSQDNTKEVVTSFVDKRIKYINTGRRLSMAHNWEFALDHIEDGFVFFLGDDDGLLPDAVKKANQLLTENSADALAWKKARYMWPNFINQNIQNVFWMSLRQGIEVRNSKQMLDKICNLYSDLDGQTYQLLPGLYNSFVSISAINKARSRAGNFFCSQCPDVYSAIALTSSISTYIYSYNSLSINGASSHSTGSSYMADSRNATTKKFLDEDNIPFHADLLVAPSVPLIIAEAVWQVRDNVPNCENYDVNIERLFSEAIRLSERLPEESRILVEQSLSRVREARGIKKKVAINGKFDEQAKAGRHVDSISSTTHSNLERLKHKIYSYKKKLLISEVSNIYEASRYFRKMEDRRGLLLIINILRLVKSIVLVLVRRVRKLAKPISRFIKILWGQVWWLRSKFMSRSLKQQAQIFLNENQANMILITGTGRSGTQLLSDMLASTGSARVFHEPNFWEDVGTMDFLRRDSNLSMQYWKDFRGVEVYRRWMEEPHLPFYCEVNGTIRYQIPAIKEIYPSSKLLMVVRDGRGVVRSVMGWPQFYGPGSKGAFALSPLPEDPYWSEWSRMSRFEKVCWSWNDTHEFLMRQIPEGRWLRLELLTTDFDYFTERLSKYIDIEISYETWNAAVSKRSRNATREYGFPEWKDWSGEQKDAFVRICGETMSKLGYAI